MSLEMEVFQPLSEQQQSDYALAEHLGIVAAEASTQARENARGLGKLIATREASLDSQSSSNSAERVAELVIRRNSFNQLYVNLRNAAERLMPPITAFETSEPPELFASETVWEAMSREQQVKAAELRTAIAAGPLKEHGVTEDSLHVVMNETDGQKQLTLIHTGKGVDIGNPKKDYDKSRNYRSVMSGKNDKLFQVKVNGVTYDTRTGMTDEVYVQKVEEARARGITLPDSKQLADETNDVWTWTMLTGEELTAGGDVQLRRVRGGQMDRGFDDPDDVGRDLRVCPAVEIK